MSETTVFEHPLNEKCRTWLRLSHLFEQLDFHRPRAEEWHARAAMSALRPCLEVFASLQSAKYLPDTPSSDGWVATSD